MQQEILDTNYLETIGKFIGTYGLAVFLVLYYAIKLYPEGRKERGEWIKQITRLRHLVDPYTRPLTKDQAKTILQLASDAIGDRFQMVFVGRAFSSRSGWEREKDTDNITLDVFKQKLIFNPKTEMKSEARMNEFSRINKEIANGLKDRMRQLVDDLHGSFKYIAEMGKRDSYRLAMLRYGNTTLEIVWTDAFNVATKIWEESLINVLDPFDRRDVDEARQFIEKHPLASTNEEAIESLFSNIRFVSVQEHASFFKSIFDRNVEEKLAAIEISEAEL